MPEARSYIDDLPDDILVEIFLRLYRYWPMDGHSERTELMVSRYWHALIINTPILWTKAFLTYGDDYTWPPVTKLAAFNRSNNALMDVCWTARGRRPVIDHHRNLITQHAHRIGNLLLSFGIEEPESIFGKGWAACKMPHLSSLSLTLLHTLYFRRGDVSLRHIQAWPQINALRKFELGNTAAGPDLLKLLFQQFPYLETLILRWFEPDRYLAAHNRQEITISAPFLRHMVLEGWFLRATCICGLRCLDAPNVEVLEAHGPRRTTLNDAHVAILVKSDPARIRKLRVCNPRRLTAVDIQLYSGLPSHVDLELGHLPADCPELFLRLLSLENLHSLTLSLYPSYDVNKSENIYQDTVLNPVNFSQFVRSRRPTLTCPTRIRLLDKDLIPVDVQRILGDKLSLLSGPPEKWFLPCEDHIKIGHDWDAPSGAFGPGIVDET